MQKDEKMNTLIARELGYAQEPLEDELKANLKTTVFGGYSKKSVSSYVERLKDTIEQMHGNMEQQVNALVREKTELVQETTLLRQQLHDTELLVKENQEQVHQLQEECTQLKSEVGKNVELDKEKEQLFKELEEENENYKKMEELLRIRMEEQDKLFDERRSLKVKLRNMEKETEQLETELSEKQRMCEEFEQRLSEVEILQPPVLETSEDSTSAELLARVNQLELEKSKLEAQLEEYQNVEPEDSSEENDTQVEQMRWQLEENQDALEFLKGKYRELEAEAKMLEQEKEMLRTQVYEATLRQKETEQEQSRNDILSQKIYELELEKKETEETLMTMKDLLGEMRDKEIKSSKDAEEEKLSYERLQQKFNQLHQQSQELRIQLKRLEQERRASDTILEKYQRQETEYILLKQNNESYQGEISHLEESIRFMFEQMNQQSDAFKSLNERYEESNHKIQHLIREKTDMQLRNVELIELLNQQAGKIAEEVEASQKALEEKKGIRQEEDSARWESIEFEGSGYMPEYDDKTVNIGDIKKRSMEMTSELRERLNKQVGGV